MKQRLQTSIPSVRAGCLQRTEGMCSLVPKDDRILSPSPLRRSQSGMSLLLTLIVIAGLTIVLITFARLVLVEKRVTQSYSKVARAEMTAEAGQADAQQLLLDLFTNFPDSATFWDPAMGSSTTPGTVFAYRDIPANEAHINANSTPQIHFRPLVSGAEVTLAANYKDALTPGDIVGDLALDFNTSAIGGDPNGWIGKLPSRSAPTPIRVPWVEILEDPTSAKSATNPAIARYAYWVEDESFKLNVNTAKSQLRGQAASQNPSAPKQANAEVPTLQGVFASLPSPKELAESIVETREHLGAFLSPLQINHASTPSDGTTAGEFGLKYKYLLSTTGSGLDLSRAGFKRVNINKVVAGTLGSSEEPTQTSGSSAPAPAQDIRRAIDQIAAVIRSNAPKFGQRFYRTTTNEYLLHRPTTTTTDATHKNNRTAVSTDYEGIYVKRVATNIYDFLSNGVNPTFIDDQGSVVAGGSIYSLLDLGFDMSPDPSEQTNVLQAVGRKNVPQLTEYVWQIRTVDFHQNVPEGSPVPENGVAVYEIEIDHYFEFWNMSSVALSPSNGDLGPEPYLVLENQPFITTNNRGGSSTNDVGIGRPFLIRLDDDFLVNGVRTKLIFEPGKATVITTDPDYAAHATTSGKVYVATALYDPGKSHTAENRVDQGLSVRPFPDPNVLPVRVPNVRRYRISSYDDRKGGDYGEVQVAPDMSGAVATKLILGNQYGLLDVVTSMPLKKFEKNNCFNLQGVGSPAVSACQIGGDNIGGWDPRGKNDALRTLFQPLNSTGNYSSYELASANLGILPVPKVPTGASLVWPSDTMVFSGPKSVHSADNPPFLTGGRFLTSIGELGGVAEPALAAHYSAADRRTRRGGGRTLMIGQPDPYWDGTRAGTLTTTELSYQTSASREWSAWRLADFFSVRDPSTDPTDLTITGQYNPNGILRDGGLVLRALVEGIQFGDIKSSDSTLAGGTFVTQETEEGTAGVTAAAIQTGVSGGKALARYLAQRLSRNFPTRFSPLWERGELSQLQIFSPFSQTGTSRNQLHAASNTDELNDRGREELFRRLADLITTRGNTYTIYSVGQTLDRTGKVEATQARKTTVRLKPVWDPQLTEDFNPASNADVTKRFRQPDRWALEILSTENA